MAEMTGVSCMYDWWSHNYQKKSVSKYVINDATAAKFLCSGGLAANETFFKVCFISP